MRRVIALLFVGWVDCLDPTQITVEITTDVRCADLHETSISVGPLGELDSRAPTTTTATCDPATGRVGSIVLVPTRSMEPAAVRVVAAFGARKTAQECANAGYKGGCIVARRAARYVSHTRLTLPVRLEAACADVPCGVSETCFGGRCVPAVVDCDPGKECVPSNDGGVTPVATIQRSFGGAGKDWLSALALDANGNLYVGGLLSGQVDLGRGPVTAFMLGSPLAASFDNGLVTRWAYVATTTASSGAYGVAARGAYAYLGGAGEGITFGMGSFSNAAFYSTMKSADGTFINGQAFTNTRGYAVAGDDQGNVWLAGLCYFGMGNISGTMCPPATPFIAGFDPNKTLRWLQTFKNATATVSAIALQGAHVVVGGVVGAPIDFGGGVVPTSGFGDAFVASLRAADGGYEWGKVFGDGALQVVHGVAADASSVWAVGDMGGTLVAGSTTLTSAGLDDAFLLRLDLASGAPMLARRFGGPNEENARAVAVDPKGNAWMCGWFQKSGDFGAGMVNAKGTNDVFVTGIAPDGTVRAARTYGGTGISQCFGVAADASALYLAGYFDGTLDFGPPPLKTVGSDDAFVVKMAQ